LRKIFLARFNKPRYLNNTVMKPQPKLTGKHTSRLLCEFFKYELNHRYGTGILEALITTGGEKNENLTLAKILL
jgi:hypothetical protein